MQRSALGAVQAAFLGLPGAQAIPLPLEQRGSWRGWACVLRLQGGELWKQGPQAATCWGG